MLEEERGFFAVVVEGVDWSLSLHSTKGKEHASTIPAILEKSAA